MCSGNMEPRSTCSSSEGKDLEHDADIDSSVTISPRVKKSNDFPKETPGPEYKIRLYWVNITLFLYLHLASGYGVYLICASATWWTTIFGEYASPV